MTESSSQQTEMAELVRQAAAGSQSAWRQIVDQYAGRLFGLIFQHTRNRDLAEEITQGTLVKLVEALQQPDRYIEQGRFEPWLFRVAMNQLRDEMRRRKRQAAPMDMSPGQRRDDLQTLASAGRNPPAPYDALIQRQSLDELRQAVAQLGEADREVIYLRFTADMSFQEIADHLQQPIGTVLARAHRAVAKLKQATTQETP